jgi:PEP-CTERM motif
MKLTTFAATAAAAAIAATAAGATTIDFATFTSPTAVSSIGPVSFVLYGGAASGSPLVSNDWDHSHTELNNSPTGNHPTSEGIKITFAGGANNVSFTYDNYGRNPAFERAFSGATFTDQSIGTPPGCNFSFCTITVAGADITTLYIDNGGVSTGWEFGVGQISYTSAVPEPASWALMLIGVGALGGALRAGRRKVAAA